MFYFNSLNITAKIYSLNTWIHYLMYFKNVSQRCNLINRLKISQPLHNLKVASCDLNYHIDREGYKERN